MGQQATVEGLRSLLGAMPSTLRPVLEGQPMESLNRLAELLGQYQGGKRASGEP